MQRAALRLSVASGSAGGELREQSGCGDRGGLAGAPGGLGWDLSTGSRKAVLIYIRSWGSVEEQCSEKNASKKHLGFFPVLPQVILLLCSGFTSSSSRLEYTGLWEAGSTLVLAWDFFFIYIPGQGEENEPSSTYLAPKSLGVGWGGIDSSQPQL